ncbi:DUF262 domain-containing protein [Zunongwangia profunda]|mgnify:FL=1|uniref:DUF262 domain-containing protein n=1 Tax=Zunongwangia profunda TaxID=398743 RepID=UPI0030D718E8|tara:strand:+ start:130 stop:1242 length:1113 start_codon:yes stop_codon:yes gene_type:complete
MKDIEQSEKQIYEEQKIVDFDTREFTIEYITDKYLKGVDEDENEIYVPEYQREFVWDELRQSKLIESIILGLPIPLLFLAENKEKDNRLEIVDGSQRIRTLAAFISNELTLIGLEKLDKLNSFSFSDLSSSRQRKFKNTPLRMIVLSDKATEDVRNEIFERINRGSDLLLAMEKRKGIYRGAFRDFIYDVCGKNKTFHKITKVDARQDKRQEKEELILRFFALSDNYQKYPRNQGIAKYLDNYLDKKNKQFSELEYKNTTELKEIIRTNDDLREYYQRFYNMVKFVDENFKYGFSKNHLPQVSRIYFEAISVGTALALKVDPDLTEPKTPIKEWIKSQEFKNVISGKYHTHIPKRIKERVEYVRDRLLGK